MLNNPILFVEDDVISSLAHCAHLRDQGFTVITAHSAEEAYRLIDRYPRLTALVSDFDLGPGDNGLDIARRARAVNQGLPVVFVSGVAAHVQDQIGRIRGSMLLAKPVWPEQIVDALWATIGLEAA